MFWQLELVSNGLLLDSGIIEESHQKHIHLFRSFWSWKFETAITISSNYVIREMHAVIANQYRDQETMTQGK